ncbi:MAM and LDL-receptor class A domain-containing protein 1-like [Bacillus rossius redtenbacheri]|uniref:MAM and LDL-receptor class A domain-containing protein 1-like n=1 Tax=Bacillus rossius redtenbacheri TaxID=93214 RepID=UPI002FDDD131
MSTTEALIATFLTLAITTATDDSISDPILEEQIRTRRQDIQEICNFGSENDLTMCEWMNRNGSVLQWQVGAGTLANWLGGPTKDAGAGDDSDRGGYAFFETSFLGTAPDMRPPQNAFLESPVLETTGHEGKCVTFSYSMEGLSAAGVRVILHPVPAEGAPVGFDRILWSAKDPTNRKWVEAELLYTYNTAHQIVFEAVAKDASDAYRRYRGHVAVDNVGLKPGSECRGHCTFESGFCDWKNDEENDFDWTLGRGSHNPSTGPATDRSSFMHGGVEGGYAYIDTSYPRRPGDVARLQSMEFDATGPDSPMCLRFWTHMYGNGIGRLSVKLSEARDANEREIWSLSGEAGNAWYQAEVPVSSPNPFMIVISGEVGKNSLGDIALDDISLTLGSCPTTPQIAATSPGDCTFEIDECGWSNAASRERVDDLDWDRVSGQATRMATHDHTLGTEKGFFMALARNNVQRPGSKAWFTSPELKGSSNPTCVSFWYVLNEPFIDNSGPSLGSLGVYLRTTDKTGHHVMNPIWRLYNHQGPEWRYAQAQIQDANDHMVVFEGTWGSSRANGVVGFDDITFFGGACSTLPPSALVRSGECRFERDTCEWMNDTTDRTMPTWRLATVSRRPANLPDKTFGAPEGYIYFDLFNQNTGSNVAKMVSPIIASSQDQQLCFTFWFAAFGAGDSAELRIVRQDNSSSDDQPLEKLWVLDAKKMDTTRPKWTSAQVTVEASTDFRLLLEGQATNGGFAVDDFSFSGGSCTIRPDVAAVSNQAAV